jgi:5'-nucleotidase
MFRAPAMLLPHESTVAHAHDQRFKNEEPKISRMRSIAAAKVETSESLVHTRPSTPTSITHCHDEDMAEDEDSDKKSERSDEENVK